MSICNNSLIKVENNKMIPESKFVKAIHYTLRTAIAMCFIGHGSFGIITKPIWCNYFAVFGIGRALAYQLMPVVGVVDILLGVMVLVYPIRAIPAWLVIWGALTALLRPLSGEPFAEFIERAGNFGAPLAFLILSGIPWYKREWFARIKPGNEIDTRTLAQLKSCLQIVAFLLLFGHGWLNLINKEGLLAQYASVEFINPPEVARIVGVLELSSAMFILIKPASSFIFILLIWKVVSEFFYPHYEFFEWIERGGSYGTLLALWLVVGKRPSIKPLSKGLLA
jgi:hypothetical protein